MKKNNMLRLASVLLVAVLLSTCAISGVFANYMTTLTTDDDARVAKWGVKIADEGADMFGEAYGAGDAIVTDKVTYADSITVDSDVKVVAPGTKGALAALTITGTPEVDVEVTYDATLTLTGWKLADNSFYCPIVITVNGVDFTINYDYVGEGDALIDFQNRVNAAIEGKTAVYHTNTDLSAVVADDVVVSWAWAYDTNTAKDTELGDQAAGIDGGVASEIALQVVTTITQVN